jgi:hypothetical protein
MVSPDDDSMNLYESSQAWNGVEQRRNQQRQNITCAEHQATREHFQAIENSLGRINDSLNKIDKDLVATISAGKVKSGVIAASITLFIVFGGFWVAEFKELKTDVASEMKVRIANGSRLDAAEGDIKSIIENFHRFESKWEREESVVHGTGVELHQYPVMRKGK